MWSWVLFITLFYLVKGQDLNGPDSELFTSDTLIRNNKSKFLDFQGSTYYFNTEFEVNFYGAMQFCKIRNMELVSIESAAENDKLSLYLLEKGFAKLKFWTSAVNMVAGGKWIWLATGNDIKYFNWDRGEPTGAFPLVATYENCIQVRHEGNRGFTWNDLNCGVKNYVICERPTICRCPTSTRDTTSLIENIDVRSSKF